MSTLLYEQYESVFQISVHYTSVSRIFQPQLLKHEEPRSSRGGAAGTAGTALAGPLFMAIRPHPQLNFCGLGLESTLLFVRVSRSIKIKVSY